MNGVVSKVDEHGDSSANPYYKHSLSSQQDGKSALQLAFDCGTAPLVAAFLRNQGAIMSDMDVAALAKQLVRTRCGLETNHHLLQHLERCF